MRTFTSRSEAETHAFGVALGQKAAPGTVVALIGDLGAGKTVLARGVGEGLAVQTRVQSPTFIIVQTHEGGRLPLWHADWYRLGQVEDLEQLGLDEVLEGDGLVLVEWADRFAEELPADHLRVHIDHDDRDVRTIRLHGTGPRHAALERDLVP